MVLVSDVGGATRQKSTNEPFVYDNSHTRKNVVSRLIVCRMLGISFPTAFGSTDPVDGVSLVELDSMLLGYGISTPKHAVTK